MSERKAECQCVRWKPVEGGMVEMKVWAMDVSSGPKNKASTTGGGTRMLRPAMHLPMKWELSLVRGNDRTVGSDRILQRICAISSIL